MDLTRTRTLCAAGPIPVAEGRAVNVQDSESTVAPPRLNVADPLSGSAHPATRRLSNARLANVTPMAVSWLCAIIRVASIDVPTSPVNPTLKITRALTRKRNRIVLRGYGARGAKASLTVAH